MTSKKVLICCDRLKYQNTGLFTFCKELIKGIERNKSKYNLDTSYFNIKSAEFLKGHNLFKLRPWNRRHFMLDKSVDIMHMTWQMENQMPINKRGRKVVLTIHDLNYLYEKTDKNIKRYTKRVQRRVDIADHIVTISEYAKQDILKHLNVGDKAIDVVYNGCSFFDGEQTNNPNYLPKKEFLFTIGTVVRKKNFHVLPALLTDNDMELIIAGNPSSYSEFVMSEAKRLGVADRVKLLGGINEADKDWYYRNCKAFVFPSLAEGFGLPVIEALAYGKPTIISRHTSLPEIGKDHCYYFDYEFDPAKMRKELAEGLEDFTSRNVEEQINYAHSYSWDNAAQRYCEIYNELLSR